MKPDQPFLFENFVEEEPLSTCDCGLQAWAFKSPNLSREESLKVLDDLISTPPLSRKTKEGLSFILKRQKQLIGDFNQGFAAHWAFQIHGVFAISLDIRDKQLNLSEIKSKVESYKDQGCVFYFKKGQMIYDSIKAYTSPWSEAIKHVKQAIKIENSQPVYLLDSNLESKRFPGEVQGVLFENVNNKLQIKKRFEMTQDDFVKTLIAGFEEK